MSIDKGDSMTANGPDVKLFTHTLTCEEIHLEFCGCFFVCEHIKSVTSCPSQKTSSILWSIVAQWAGSSATSWQSTDPSKLARLPHLGDWLCHHKMSEFTYILLSDDTLGRFCLFRHCNICIQSIHTSQGSDRSRTFTSTSDLKMEGRSSRN